MASSSKQNLALAIIDFLRSSVADKTISENDSEQIEIATSCIADAFGVDAQDEKAMKTALGGQSLLSVYNVFAKMQSSKAAPASDATSATTARASAAAPTAEQKAEADALKAKGNSAMTESKFDVAIEFYSQAIAIVSDNVIYLSNRAAAYSALGRHNEAAEDARKATEIDPNYAKAWSRLGLALYALDDAEGSMEAYSAGIKAEGNGGSDAMKKGYTMAQRKVEESSVQTRSTPATAGSEDGDQDAGAGAGGMPDLSSLAGMFGGAGGAGGAGGMPDFSSMMKNPMLQQMAQNLLKNPGMMNNLLSNPKLRDMANSFGMNSTGGGGSMPDLSSLMNDPSIAELAKNFKDGQGPSS